jgi:hypothetical protein
MRVPLAALAAGLFMLTAAPADAQRPYGPPPGSYQRHCTDVRMEGQFLHAYCRGSQGAGRSSINVLSCSGDIGVDPRGGLTCVGPGGGAPPAVRPAPPGYGGGPGYGVRPPGWQGREPQAWLYPRRDWRGQPLGVRGEARNLGGLGLNDRVRSIRLERGSPPWLVCTGAGYRGRCVTIRASVADTRTLGMENAISSLRPAW